MLGTSLAATCWLNVQSGFQDPENDTLGILQSARSRNLKRGLREAWTLQGPRRLHLSVREKRERNLAQGAPQGQVETKRSPNDSDALSVRGHSATCKRGFSRKAHGASYGHGSPATGDRSFSPFASC